MTLYSLRTALDDYRITKFDSDLNVESSYLLGNVDGAFACECPAGTRSTCRHRQMLPNMLAADICDTEWFYDFERKLVVDANGNLRPAPDPIEPSPAMDEYFINIPAGAERRKGLEYPQTKPSPPSWRRL